MKDIHPLHRWLFEHQITRAQFGEMIDTSQSAISEWINRLKYPSMEKMVRIREATGGDVTPNDFLPAQTVKTRRRA